MEHRFLQKTLKRKENFLRQWLDFVKNPKIDNCGEYYKSRFDAMISKKTFFVKEVTVTRTIRVALTEAELRRLGESAAQNCRRPQEQVRFFVLNALGLIDRNAPEN